ncbi:MAG: NAD+ synthase [Bacteroidales bacterium]|jgi:NAD+ synthase (glutamine-hydrolysing)|nr:NAD+ synthase [Bacteroidales bacterium]
MKIALAQLNYHVGDFASNTARIISAINQAKILQADVVVFAELSVCGYPPRDFLEFDDFIRQCRQAVETIALACQGIAAVVGAPSINPAPRGKPLYNTAYFLADGAIKAMTNKTLLPNYDVFDEYRYFEPNRLPYSLIEHLGCRFAVTICEDLWNVADDPLYVRNPMDELISLNPDLVINISASPFNYDQPAIRREVLSRNAITYHLPVIYVNQVGGQTELIFDGDSMVIAPNGDVIAGLKRFEEDLQIIDFNPENQSCILHHTSRSFPDFSPLEERKIQYPASSIQMIHSALVLGIRDYFNKMGFAQAIIGLSGGIDSAVTLVLAAEALGPENVRAILLPSQFSSDHSITDARTLAENLGVPYEIIPIEEGFKALKHTLEPQFGNLPFNLTEENIQARLRAVILMALSNKFGYILLNTSNKSEAAVGYGTLYGDMSGGLSVLGDVYKTQVYELARLINSNQLVIPENSILKPPSAELRPGQKDSDSLPGYDILDQILFKYIEQRTGPEELIREGFDASTVRKVLKLVNTSEYKRYQTPPILRVSPKAFGMGRRMPIVARYLS